MTTELKSKFVTCKKEHQCSWCAEAIAIGEDASYRVYVYDSNFHSEYMHIECYQAMNRIHSSDYEEYEQGSFVRGKLELKTEFI